MADEGTAWKRRRDEVNRLRGAMNSDNLERFSRARSVITNVWPALKDIGSSDDAETVAGELEELLESRDLFDRLSHIVSKSESIHNEFAGVLGETHSSRNGAYSAALDRISSDERLPRLASDDRDALLRSLNSRVCESYAIEVGETACSSCNGSFQLIESASQADVKDR